MQADCWSIGCVAFEICSLRSATLLFYLNISLGFGLLFAVTKRDSILREMLDRSAARPTFRNLSTRPWQGDVAATRVKIDRLGLFLAESILQTGVHCTIDRGPGCQGKGQ
jgi:hypothetical protein